MEPPESDFWPRTGVTRGNRTPFVLLNLCPDLFYANSGRADPFSSTIQAIWRHGQEAYFRVSYSVLSHAKQDKKDERIMKVASNTK